MRQSVAVVALALALVVRAVGALQTGDYTRAIEVGGRRRTYLVHVPPGTSAAPLPIVIALHGGLSNGAGMARFSGLSDKADRSGFSVEHSLRAWIAADGCPAEPLVTGLPARVDDGTQVTRKTYGPCREGAEVVLLMIENGGHTWPGRQPPVRFLGKATANVDANDAMWDFFVKHPLPATGAAGAHPAGER